MEPTLNVAELSVLAGREITVYWERVGTEAVVLHGVIEIVDIAGDQDGPALTVLVNDDAHGLGVPSMIPLNSSTVKRLLAADQDATLEITIAGSAS